MGFMDNIKSGINKTFPEYAHSQAANKQIKKKAQAQYYQEKEKQEGKIARERARIEANQRIKSMRTSQNQSQGFGGFSGFGSSGGNPLGGFFEAESGGYSHSRKKGKRRNNNDLTMTWGEF